MPYPVPIIEIAFDDGPYVVSPTWTDVTAYVREFSTSRGTPDDWTLQADGSASVTLSNRDRRFDPFNTSGPYYGKLLPRRQIRIRATSGGVTYDVFRGFIAGWPPEWTDAGYDSTVTLSCFDALQLLGSSSLPADWSRDYILSLNPRHYWPCDDAFVPFQIGQKLKDYGSFPLDLSTTEYASQGLELAEGLGSSSIQSVVSSSASAGGTPAITATNFTFSFWSNISDGSVGGCIGTTDFGIGVNPFTGLFFVGVKDAGTYRQWDPSTPFDFNYSRHYAFTYNTTTKALQLFVDGSLIATTLSTSAGTPSSTTEYVTLYTGAFQQVCLWTSILTQTQIKEIYTRSLASFTETTSARLQRIIGETPFPTALIDYPIDPASSVLDITNDAPTASSELAKVSNSEYAPLFVSKNGVLTLYQQNQIRTSYNSRVSQATYGTGGIPIGPNIQLQYDGDSMRNVANVEMSGGGVVIDTNSSSVTIYGEAEQYVSTQVSSRDDAQQIADIVSGWGGQVYPKVSPVSVVLSPDGTWGSTLGLDLFYRFTLAVTPKTGNTITVPMLLTRISHSATPERWVTTIEGSARWAAVFILNTSTLGGTDLLG